jgi:carbon starvation protein
MNAAFLALMVFAAFALGYRFYSKFLAEHVFALDPDEPVPSKEFRDGIDYVPTRKHVLWGHHYASIAGAAPIVGPALAVIWGWLPALLWVALGTLFMGAVHDFSALVISLRNKGRSIGEIAGRVISPRARNLVLIIISFLIWIVLAVFAFIIGTLFVQSPGSIFPINIQILLALLLGWLVYRSHVGFFWPSLIAYVVLLIAILFGNPFADAFPAIKDISVGTWVWLLMIYSFLASVLPVWMLLQPRDYLNSHQLITGIVLLTSGLIVLQPTIQAPAVVPNPPGAPPLIPFLFITIACGAISGFHGLVSSGTTSKQVECMADARPIGYGGMLGEGALALLSVLAATAGFVTATEWAQHYASWGAASGLGPKLAAFVNGGGRFIAALGIPTEIGTTFVAVMVIAFAATSSYQPLRGRRHRSRKRSRSCADAGGRQRRPGTLAAIWHDESAGGGRDPSRRDNLAQAPRPALHVHAGPHALCRGCDLRGDAQRGPRVHSRSELDVDRHGGHDPRSRPLGPAGGVSSSLERALRAR